MIISLFASALGTVTRKYYTDKSGEGVASKCIYTAAGCLVAALCLAIVGDIMKPSLFTVLLSILFGAMTALQGIAMLAAMRLGPVSYTMMFSSFSTVITALSGVPFFHESITGLKIIGILLMLVSFVLAVEKSDDKSRAVSLPWLILSILSMLMTGGIGVMQKIHQSSSHRGELNAFLILAFAASTLFSLVMILISARREGLPPLPDRRGMLLTLALLIGSGYCIAVNNKLNLYLAGKMESAVFFPLVNGGGLVLATVAAFLIFRERLSRRRLLGIVLGTASVVFLCNPFGA
jgi:drug/metabolite transporter (DMT)-like permease